MGRSESYYKTRNIVRGLFYGTATFLFMGGVVLLDGMWVV